MRAFILFVALAWIAAAAPTLAQPAIGQPAPALQATELDGRPFDLAAERGKVVIVNFWATWCVPCRAEMPALDGFYRAFRHEGLVVIGISVDRWGDRDKVRAVMRAFAYPAAMNGDAAIDDFPRPDEIPVTYIIDRGGVLRRVMRPDRIEITPRSLAATVLPLLRRTSPPAGSASTPTRTRQAPDREPAAHGGVRYARSEY